MATKQMIFHKGKLLASPIINSIHKNLKLTRRDEFAELKRNMNRRLVDFVPMDKTIIDAYAGTGLSTIEYARKGHRVIAIEERRKTFDCLKQNVEAFGLTNVELHRGDNLKYLKKCNTADESIGLIDLDPFKSPYEQIKESLRILKNGILPITSGEVFYIRRYSKIDSNPQGVFVRRYGREVRDWHELPFVVFDWMRTTQRPDLNLGYWVLFHNLFRMVALVGDQTLSVDLQKEFPSGFELIKNMEEDKK